MKNTRMKQIINEEINRYILKEYTNDEYASEIESYAVGLDKLYDKIYQEAVEGRYKGMMVSPNETIIKDVKKEADNLHRLSRLMRHREKTLKNVDSDNTFNLDSLKPIQPRKRPTTMFSRLRNKINDGIRNIR